MKRILQISILSMAALFSFSNDKKGKSTTTAQTVKKYQYEISFHAYNKFHFDKFIWPTSTAKDSLLQLRRIIYLRRLFCIFALSRMSNYPSFSDQQLVLLLQRGDRGAFAEIYNRYQTLLFLYSVKKLQDQESAEDIVQEVFVSLWNAKQGLNSEMALGPYLYRVVLNKILNIFRNR